MRWAGVVSRRLSPRAAITAVDLAVTPGVAPRAIVAALRTRSDVRIRRRTARGAHDNPPSTTTLPDAGAVGPDHDRLARFSGGRQGVAGGPGPQGRTGGRRRRDQVRRRRQ